MHIWHKSHCGYEYRYILHINTYYIENVQQYNEGKIYRIFGSHDVFTLTYEFTEWYVANKKNIGIQHPLPLQKKNVHIRL